MLASLPVHGCTSTCVRAPERIGQPVLAGASPAAIESVARRGRRPQRLADRSAPQRSHWWSRCAAPRLGDRRADRPVVLAAARAGRLATREKPASDGARIWLAFARQKLEELDVLAERVCGGRGREREALLARTARRSRAAQSRRAQRRGSSERARVGARRPSCDARRAPDERRRPASAPLKPAALPDHHHRLVPADRRDPPRARQLQAGELDEAGYEAAHASRRSSAACASRRSSGLDVLVHGEFERNDMVEYFGEQLDGFAFTQPAGCSSYGSRCVKPPIIYRRRQPPGADDGRLVALRPVADRAADEGHADRPGHDPAMVVRARRPAARRDLPPDRAGDPRRGAGPGGGRHRA